jgi:dihydroflavonol-4-reductase
MGYLRHRLGATQARIEAFVRALVTGGTGFVGAHVVRQLLASGHEVVCTARASSNLLTVADLPVEIRRVPLRTSPELDALVSTCDAIFHCAGVFDPGPRGAETMRRVHVDATEALCRAGARAGVGRMVLCSSSITVGFGGLTAPGDEHTPLDPTAAYGARGPLRSYYETKLAAEQLAAQWTRRGFEVVTVNPDFVVGAWDIKPTSGALIATMMRHWVPIWPRGGKCFVDAVDTGAAHVAAWERGSPGGRYLIGAHNTTYRQFMQLVGDVVGRRPPVAPAVGTRVLGQLGRVIARFDAHRAAPFEPNLLRAMHQERYRSGALAQRELGMQWTPLRTSVESAVRWFETHARS